MFLESTIFESWFVKCTEKKIIGVENALGNLNCLFQDPYPESSIYWGLRWSPDIWNFNQIAEAILLSLGLLFRNTAVEAKTWIEEKLLLTTHSFLQHCSLWYSFFPSSDHSYFIFLVFLLTLVTVPHANPKFSAFFFFKLSLKEHLFWTYQSYLCRWFCKMITEESLPYKSLSQNAAAEINLADVGNI